MARSRVFILYSHGLFARGVQSLLSREQGVELVGVEREGQEGLERIRCIQPDVVLVDSSSARQEAGPALAEIFREVPGARVISLSLHENGIDIYDRQRVVAAGPEELVKAIIDARG